MATPAGPEYGVKYTLTGPDGTIAVFNDSTDPNFVGALSPESSGLDSAEVREAAVDSVEADGGVHGNFYYGRRPVVLQGTIIATSAEDRNKKAAKIQGASNAMRGDAVLKWTPVGGVELELKLRRQQPVRITKGFVKEFQIPLVSADARIYTTAVANSAAAGSVGGPASKLPGGAGKEGAGGVWINPTNILTKNNVYAIAAIGAIKTEVLFGKEFGFSVPLTATILGIEAFIERKRITIFADTTTDFSVQLRKAGVAVGSDLKKAALWGSTEEVISYGGAANLWGTTWTPAQVNESGFGIGLAVKVEGEAELQVDSMEIKVYWKIAPIIVNFTNEGNSNYAPTMKITGPGKIFNIKNVTTGETLVIEATLAAGHFISIDFKNRTILEDGTKNIYSALNFASSAWWELRPGANEITVEITENSTAATKAELLSRSAWV